MRDSTKVVAFGEHELDFGRGELRHREKPVDIQPTPLRLLLYLAAHRDRVVSRMELLEAIWPGVVVGDEALTTALAEARHAVGDDGAAQRVIRTHKGRGYRFVAEVLAGADEPVRDTKPARVMLVTRWGSAAIAVAVAAVVAALAFSDRWSPAPAPAADTAARAPSTLDPIRSLAVLPLANLSGDPEQEYYADGMTETLIAELAKLPGVRVVSRTSVMQFKGTNASLPEIAKQLNVDGVIEGSVMRAENRVRITAQLVDARGDRHVWAEQYDRELARVFEIQGEVARTVAGQIALALTPEQRARLAPRKPVDPRAQEAYFRGLVLRARGDASLRSFEQAIQLDPEFAPAWAALSRAHVFRCADGCIDPRGVGSRAREAALRAIALDATLADSHVAMGWVHSLFDWNWEAAERELRLAAELSSVDFEIGPSLAGILLITGRREEALAEYDRWLANAPDTLLTRTFQQDFLRSAGRIEEALELATRALEGDPENPAMLYWRAENLILLGRHADAIPIYKRAVPAMNDFTAQDAAEVEQGWRAGDLDGYLRVWERIDSRYGRWTHAACGALLRGDHEAAFGDLERGFETRDPRLRLLTVVPCLTPLHSDPRFADLARRMNLPLPVLPGSER